ncbi:MAG TPA: helix-turn-helix domain-containing protein, partial [Sedimentisphaerales bacterium]|nr:helix-turn-helix domain-containing protein [Sedimentisphaerales bacterium]
MANQLKMAVVQAILTLRRLGWSQRQIAEKLGIHRETVARYVHAPPGEAKPATNPIPGPESLCEPFRAVIET